MKGMSFNIESVLQVLHIKKKKTHIKAYQNSNKFLKPYREGWEVERDWMSEKKRID